MRWKDTKDPTPTWRWKLKNSGVDVSELNPNILAYLGTLEPKYQDMILATSGNDSKHSEGSRHYTGNAVDLRIHNKKNPFEDALYKRIAKDPARLGFGLTLLDPTHGTAPHIDLSYGTGSQSNKDVWLNPHSQEASFLIENLGTTIENPSTNKEYLLQEALDASKLRSTTFDVDSIISPEQVDLEEYLVYNRLEYAKNNITDLDEAKEASDLLKTKINQRDFLVELSKATQVKLVENPNINPTTKFQAGGEVKVEVESQAPHPQLNFSEVDIPENKVLKYQLEKGLTPTGRWNTETAENYYDTKVQVKESTYDADKLEEGLVLKQEWQEKIKGADIEYADFFGMDKAVKSKIGGDNIFECIGGVCTFLRDFADTEFNAPDGVYYSNYTFENNAEKEGWQFRTGDSPVKPQVGDIVQQRGPGGVRHASLVKNYDKETGEYEIVDNRGKDEARIRYKTAEELKEYSKIYDTDKTKGGFYRRVKFDGIDLAKAAFKGTGVPVRGSDLLTEFDRASDIQIEDKEAGFFDFRRNRYNSGVNKALKSNKYSDIPTENLKKIAIIASAIPAGESEFGKGIKYNIESAAPTKVRAYRDLTRNSLYDIVTNNYSSPALSTGLSQINPTTGMTKEMKERHFPGKTDHQISKKLARNSKVAGEITMELMVTKYREQIKRPELYNDDESRFWEALVYRHKSPNFFTTREVTEDMIDERVLPYVENQLKSTKEFRVKE